MRKQTLILLYVAVVITVSVNASEKGEWWQVEIVQGPVRGRRDSNEELYVFYNIPYATAPIGEHKFKAPLKPPTWTEPYDAIDAGIICPQFQLNFLPENLKAQENCLIANVYVPNTEEKNLSVLVYVHGGGFQLGYGDWFKARNLMKPKDIIVVTFNYRIGIHGFLCLGTEDVPGNAGMKDQVALLRWVQENIATFGGNPNDVTIAGYSAGSASVDLLMISKSAEGLFHKIIPESGVNIAVFTVQVDPLQNAKDHAKKLNFTNTDDIYALEGFYKSLSYDILTSDAFMDQLNPTRQFTPCIERNTGTDVFLAEPPLNVLKRGDYKRVPSLYGFSNMEGLLTIGFFNTTWKNRLNEKFSDFLPANLKFETDAEKEEIAKRVKTYYFGEKPIDDDNVLRYIDYFSDIFYIYSTLKEVKLHLEAGHDKVYLYEYSFVDDDIPVIPHTNVRGATHCSQTMAVLDGKGLNSESEDDISEEYKNMKKVIRELWHNFVRTGKPVPEGSPLPVWPAVGADGTPHMSLGQTLELRSVLAEERFLFWDDIYNQYYREPIPPPDPSFRSRMEL